MIFLRIVFRTNGGINIGLGHYYRCLNLAYAFKQINPQVKIIFIQNKELNSINLDFKFYNSEYFDLNDLNLINKLNPSVIIFDSYLASSNYLNHLNKDFFLIILDDNNDIYGEIQTNILINGNIHANDLVYKKKNEDVRLLLGPKYLLLNKEYWNINQRKKPILPDLNSILITTGGSDFHNLMVKFVDSLKNTNYKKKIVIGPFYDTKQIKTIKNRIDNNYSVIFKPKSLFHAINSSEIIISASGTTIYEILTLNRLPLIYCLAENQKLIANNLEKKGIINLGYFKKIKYRDLPEILEHILSNKLKIKKKYEYIYDLFDGNGALRIANIILKEIE